VARSGDYHLDWIGPDGSVVSGSPVAYRPVPVRQADKEAWVTRSGGGLRIGMTVENGRTSVRFSRGGGGAASPDVDDFEWPERKPPFAATGVWVTPEGDAWVERSVSAREPARFDVFGPDAELKGWVTLPEGRTLVGLGRGVVYLVRTDEFDLQWLERYRRER
jgi:hypothetical protein